MEGVFLRETSVACEKGGHVVVRRLRRSLKGDICLAAGLNGDVTDSAAIKLQELVVRAAAVVWQGVIDCETGAAFEGKLAVDARYAGLGPIAPAGLYDALTDADILAIFKASGWAEGTGAEREKN